MTGMITRRGTDTIVETYRAVESWEEAYLDQLPSEETDRYEYKSGRTSTEKLKDKIAIAGSAFWNSGGGIFIVGVDRGKVDGGIPDQVGRQSVRDWADQVLARVEPSGPYAIKLISAGTERSAIKQGNVVLVISFGESFNPPHMAPDNKYYIRAGAHSVPASHYLIEAIRARRRLQYPLLRGVLRMHPQKTRVVQLAILNLSDAPALNVELTLEPLPKKLGEHFAALFPLLIPVISREQPFAMDISIWSFGSQIFGDEPVSLKLRYANIAGRQFVDEQTVDRKKNIGPMQAGSDTVAVMENLKDEVKKLRSSIEQLPQRIREQWDERGPKE
jgi:hypothetical protein